MCRTHHARRSLRSFVRRRHTSGRAASKNLINRLVSVGGSANKVLDLSHSSRNKKVPTKITEVV